MYKDGPKSIDMQNISKQGPLYAPVQHNGFAAFYDGDKPKSSPDEVGMTQTQKAAHLLELHHGKGPLVLVNVWDAASACIVAHCGFPAIATSSAAVANVLGHADRQHVPSAEMADAIRRIAGAVRLPVTADIEAGFSSTVQELEWSN